MASKNLFLISFLMHFCITICYTNAAGLPKFSAILIFGDSLVDTGNNNFVQTLIKANHPPYGMSLPNHAATGRFSNGKLMSDMLAEALGIKEFVPPFGDPNLASDELKTGVCFASAGSGYDDMTTMLTGVIPVSKQIENFRQYVEKLKAAVGAEQANQTLSNSLVFVVAGSNDYLLNFYVNPLRASEYGDGGYQDFLQKKLQVLIKAVYDLGCRNMMIAGIPPLPDGPTYNQKLKALLPQVQGSLPGSKLVYADIYTPMADISVNPLKYGLVNIETPCCGMYGECTQFSAVCANPDQYYRWDIVHPTQAVYRVVAKYLQDNSLTQFAN